MIKRLEDEIDEVMAIWLETNLETHAYINRDYWIKHMDYIKTLIQMAEVYIYKKDNKVVAFIVLFSYTLNGIFVKKKYQAKGIGTELLNYAKKKKKCLELKVYEKNTKAYNFYVGEGFVKIDEMIDEDNGEHQYIMEWRK